MVSETFVLALRAPKANRELASGKPMASVTRVPSVSLTDELAAIGVPALRLEVSTLSVVAGYKVIAYLVLQVSPNAFEWNDDVYIKVLQQRLRADAG